MVEGLPRGLASQEYEEGKEEQNSDDARLRAYMQQYRNGGIEGSSSDEEGGGRDDEEVAEPLPYSQLENVEDEEDEEFGEFAGSGEVHHQIDDETLFACVLANMDRSEERRGGGGGTGSEDEGLFSTSRDSVKEAPLPVRVSIPPLDDDKRASIMAAMARMKVPAPRPTVDSLVDSLLEGYKNKS